MKIQPIPAIAYQGGQFQVTNSGSAGGFSCVEPKMFGVPDNDDAVSRAVRAHEYGHLAVLSRKYEPKNFLQTGLKMGITNDWMQAALDCFVNSYMAYQGNREIANLSFGELPKVVTKTQKAQFVMRARSLKSDTRELVDDLPAELSSLEQTALKEVRQGFTFSHFRGKPKKLGTAQLKQLLSLQRLLGDDSDETPPPTPTTSKKGGDTTGAGMGTPLSVGGAVPWGAMEVRTAPLAPSTNQAIRRALRVKPDFAGDFKYPERALIPAFDGDCFGLRKRVAGGTMLIDTSGSMHMSASDLEQVIAQRPGMTIAHYESIRENTAGVLEIVAKHGRIGKAGHFGGGNVVDGPALRWLAKQQHPRIWICDGHVTGVKDAGTDWLRADAMKVATAARLVQYLSLPNYFDGRAEKGITIR